MRRIVFLVGVALLCLSVSAYGLDSVYFSADSAVMVVEDTLYMRPLGGGNSTEAL